MLWFFAARLYNEAFQFNTLKLIMFGDCHAILHKRQAAVDWDELLGVSQKYGMQPSLFYVLAQLRNLTGADVPQDVLAALQPNPLEIPHENDWGDVMPKLFSRSIVQELSLA